MFNRCSIADSRNYLPKLRAAHELPGFGVGTLLCGRGWFEELDRSVQMPESRLETGCPLRNISGLKWHYWNQEAAVLYPSGQTSTQSQWCGMISEDGVHLSLYIYIDMVRFDDVISTYRWIFKAPHIAIEEGGVGYILQC